MFLLNFKITYTVGEKLVELVGGVFERFAGYDLEPGLFFFLEKKL